MADHGYVKSLASNHIGTLIFSHPKGNSLPKEILASLLNEIRNLNEKPEVRVIVLKSEGAGAFCSGASFEELRSISTQKDGDKFFSQIAEVLLALRSSPKFVIGRIQGKAVGGGVGLVSACDYLLAHESASLRLSELALGIGPFVVGPVIERKIGHANYAYMSIDADWRDATWAKQAGLYTEIFKDVAALDGAVDSLAAKLAACSPEAMKELKRVLWEGTEHWEKLLPQRATISGKLVLSEYCKGKVAAVGK